MQNTFTIGTQLVGLIRAASRLSCGVFAKTDSVRGRQQFVQLVSLFCALQLGLIAANAQSPDDRIVVAQRGEGIYAILRRMGMDPEVYLERFIEINRSKLDSTRLLTAGMTYLVPERDPMDEEASREAPEAGVSPTSILEEGARLYPIFGERYREVVTESRELNDAILYIVSGHGGPDPGAIGSYRNQAISEDEYAYDVSLRLALNLIKKGAEVHIIVQDPDDGIRSDRILRMDNDETVALDQRIPLNQRQRLKQRTDLINRLYREDGRYHRVIALHVDSRSSGRNIDVFFYHHQKSVHGRALADRLHETFASKYARHQPGRQYHGTVSPRGGLFIIRHTRPPVVYIELGNIKNTRDQRRLVLEDNRQALANWITHGIVVDYHNSR